MAQVGIGASRGSDTGAWMRTVQQSPGATLRGAALRRSCSQRISHMRLLPASLHMNKHTRILGLLLFVVWVSDARRLLVYRRAQLSR